jgi:hypothetical protein
MEVSCLGHHHFHSHSERFYVPGPVRVALFVFLYHTINPYYLKGWLIWHGFAYGTWYVTLRAWQYILYVVFMANSFALI